MSTRKPDPNQFEFDLITPLIPYHTWQQLERVRKKAGLRAPENPEEVSELRGLAVRLHHLDMTYDERRVSLSQELGEARVLLGKSEWATNEKLWTRLAKRDPLRFKKLILIAKRELGLC